jgi:hypothetical protein
LAVSVKAAIDISSLVGCIIHPPGVQISRHSLIHGIPGSYIAANTAPALPFLIISHWVIQSLLIQFHPLKDLDIPPIAYLVLFTTITNLFTTLVLRASIKIWYH